MGMGKDNIEIKVGLEIHQQLNTKHKLFCKCPTKLIEDPCKNIVKRFLRPSKSELGEVDPAALFEYMKHKEYVYEAPEEASCLVELDEEPPHDLNQEALEIALEITLMLKAKPVNEVHVMRKIVIDGSNTTGFQRTAIIAMGGIIEDDEGNVEIKTICLEEESARKILETEDKVVYKLDRLGIPLIEISTAPTIRSPEHAKRIALKLGRILRATGKVKRGIGTIRQDLNISIPKGARVEIKGVQDLNLIPRIIEYEVKRQQKLLEIREELLNRKIRREDLIEEIIDVTDIFIETKSKIIRKGLSENKRVYAVKLKGFTGLLKMEIQPNRRLATEMLERAKLISGIEGIIHTDELPGYGINQNEVLKIREKMNAEENDAIVIVIDNWEKAEKALKAVIQRAREAIIGVPEETRAVNEDGTTRYSRPMPGAARMYPETDIRPISITQELIDKISSRLPEHPEANIKRYIEIYGLSRKLAEELIDSDREKILERIVEEIKVNPTLVASTLVYTINMLKNENIPVERISEEILIEVFKLIAEGELVKEAIPDLLRYIAQNPMEDLKEVLKKIGKLKMDLEELEKLVREEVDKAEDLIKIKGIGSMSTIMGKVMKNVRGRIDGKIVSEIVKRIIEEKIKLNY
ncbi:MAG: Glu-tRNA(Gln) amidotransferase subunit GatE [Candidatus Methanomethylicia archaeon]|nr:Glu-tRNA(Gln) amidotransferase subunit GatE [Candidatus Methanomethylicia archaeon]